MSLINKIFNIKNETDFNSLALKIFDFQYQNSTVYRSYVDLVKSKKINHYLDIPFLPIQFFKTNKVITKKYSTEKVFLSSGTTQKKRSHHYIHNLDLYKKSFKIGFEKLYSNISEWTILALLPSYLDQGDSSLIYMVNHFIENGTSESRYIDFDFDSIKSLSIKLRDKKVLLIGVTYALLDIAEKGSIDLKNWVIMETGGMKGKKKEIVRNDLHKKLMKSFNVDAIHSEYGMTELLSQAYSKRDGLFCTPPWMKIIIRDFEDPFSYKKDYLSGGINIIDLANLYSCSFIETQDIGKKFDNGEFEVLGRFDKAEIRGCNLLSF